jgi:hypothetical protein
MSANKVVARHRGRGGRSRATCGILAAGLVAIILALTVGCAAKGTGSSPGSENCGPVTAGGVSLTICIERKGDGLRVKATLKGRRPNALFVSARLKKGGRTVWKYGQWLEDRQLPAPKAPFSLGNTITKRAGEDYSLHVRITVKTASGTHRVSLWKTLEAP